VADLSVKKFRVPVLRATGCAIPTAQAETARKTSSAVASRGQAALRTVVGSRCCAAAQRYGGERARQRLAVGAGELVIDRA
jgi:hypothetical protein